MTEIVITLEGAPKGKGRPRFTRSGHAYTPKATTDYEHSLRMRAKDAMKGRPPLVGPLAVTVGAFFPIAKSWTKAEQAAAIDGSKHHMDTPDLDNIAKTLDALNGVVWGDDKQVVQLTAMKRYSSSPALVVTVRAA